MNRTHTDVEHDDDADLARLESALDRVPRRMIELALVEMGLPAGLTLRPPWTVHGHAKIVWPDGSSCSLTLWLAYLRALAVESWRCEGCGSNVSKTPSRNGRVRDFRVDRRWCSSACRQRAYRHRNGTNVASRNGVTP